MRRLVHKSSRLVLRPLRRHDYSAWKRAYGEGFPAQNKWDVGPRPCTRTLFESCRRRHADWARADECYVYGAFLGQELVGVIDISIHARDSLQFANFGYRVFNRHWRQGLGREMARAGLVIGLKALKLQRLEASIDLDNRRSIRLARAIGMEREGIKRAYWFQEGRWDDQVIYVARPEHLR